MGSRTGAGSGVDPVGSRTGAGPVGSRNGAGSVGSRTLERTLERTLWAPGLERPLQRTLRQPPRPPGPCGLDSTGVIPAALAEINGGSSKLEASLKSLWPTHLIGSRTGSHPLNRLRNRLSLPVG